ncbi:MAG: phosphatase PAP2 family protein [Saprospiraceae bacterium]|nr:phosphatase PAP2 family protein [Lewinella sp.]
MLKLVFAGICWLMALVSFGQNVPTDTLWKNEGSVYNVNPWISGSIALVGLYTNATGLKRLRKLPLISEERLNRLNEDDLIGLDRIALRQDPTKVSTDKAQRISDLLLYSGALSPVILVADRSIRREWLDVTLMYLETQAVTSNFYTWGPLGPSIVERLRPAAYYTELPLEEREAGNNRNSFYSGHVASTATGWFFVARVFSDFHPELGGKKWLLYGLAAIPPTIVGINRVRALRHFPTDTIIGGIIGATVGVLIPSIHKRSKGHLQVGAAYDPEVKGVALGWRF